MHQRIRQLIKQSEQTGFWVSLLLIATCELVFFVYISSVVIAPDVRPSKPRSVRPLAHVVIILEENKPSGKIIGNTQAPYINMLASTYARASSYAAITNPSLPNYIALTSGTTAGISDDCNPPNIFCQANVPNIADSLEAAGKSWKYYGESMPARCGITNSGDYVVRHNPFAYYPNIRNNPARCKKHIVPFGQFQKDAESAASLPNYSFIVPNVCHDMHDCSIKTGDDWLATNVPAILRSPAFTTQRSLLVVVWDEGVRGNNTVAAIFAGTAARRHVVSPKPYTHYSLLRTIEDEFDLPSLSIKDRQAMAMSDMLR